MKSNYRIFSISLIFAFLLVGIISNLQGEIPLLLLLPGSLFNWFVEQLLIEIRSEPYFKLDNFSNIFNCIFYTIIFFLCSKILIVNVNFSRNNEKQTSKNVWNSRLEKFRK